MYHLRNIILVLLGLVALGIGIIGIVLPILPTTPFFLLAAFLFANGSERFHGWFIETNLYKKYIGQMVGKKEMTKKAKRNALSIISILLLMGFIFSPVWYAKVIIAIVFIGHWYMFLFRIKTVLTEEEIERKREDEKKMLQLMIRIYCHGNHNTHGKNEICKECKHLETFAITRTDKCPFMATKTFCSACKVHCYTKEMQQNIRLVMKYAGPRMMLYHPLAAIRHGIITLQTSITNNREIKMRKKQVKNEEAIESQ